jgi:predicted phosphodiesterase
LGTVRYAIVADIHANLAAFTAVLDDIERRGGVVEVWCLGDVVGYGPDPHQCLELLWRYNHVCVAGNHDWGATGRLDISNFNPFAAAACRWTAEQLSREDIQYLESRPLVIQKDEFTLAHGSPRESLQEYLLSISSALASFAYFTSPFCLVGHSHLPLIFEMEEAGSCSLDDFPADVALSLAENRLIINPGSVGQPRDGDPRASYAIYDDEARAISCYRTSYNIALTQQRMTEHGLPVSLVRRLSYGL